MSQLFTAWDECKPIFEGRLKHLFVFEGQEGERQLVESINYALFTGGKRFRPMLTMASGLSLKQPFEAVLDWALSIEMIHTYSLIHDDLPSMDNDDYRRGLPTVHKKFGEACALLAGDALLTEAFSHLAQNTSYHKALPQLLTMLGECAGYKGMVGGQANDCLMSSMDQEGFLRTHKQKTAALIRAAVMGPYLIFETKDDVYQKMNEFAETMGILFQIKDDILDFEEGEDGLSKVASLEEIKAMFDLHQAQARSILKSLTPEIIVDSFEELLNYNSTRSH